MTDLNGRRQAAIKRIRAKRAFGVHAAIYVAVNLLLIAAGPRARIFLANLADPRLGRRARVALLDRLSSEADFGGRDSARNGERALSL
jgi:hypothetical protein